MEIALLKTPFIFVFNDRSCSDCLQVEIQRKFCGFRAPPRPGSLPRGPRWAEFSPIPESFSWPEVSLEMSPIGAGE